MSTARNHPYETRSPITARQRWVGRHRRRLRAARQQSGTDGCQAVRLFLRCIHLGEADDWETWIGRYGGRLRRLACRALGRAGLQASVDAVDDLTQEIYCRLVGGAALGFRGRGDASLWAYLSTIARCLALNTRRSGTTLKRGGHLKIETVSDDRCRGAQANPEDLFLQRERRRLFAERCRRWGGGASEDRALVLRLALLEGWSSREIAAGLGGGWSVSRIDSCVYRFRQEMERRGWPIPSRRQVFARGGTGAC